MVKVTSKNKTEKKIRPALTPEARENQLIYLATELAEKQLKEGTASSQVITHYLKLGSTKEKIEREILEKQKELISAKTETLKSTKKIEELYANALNNGVEVEMVCKQIFLNEQGKFAVKLLGGFGADFRNVGKRNLPGENDP